MQPCSDGILRLGEKSIPPLSPKGARVAICELVNHRTRRVEMRCAIDGEMHESRAENDPLLLFDQADSWKAAFEEKGWQ